MKKLYMIGGAMGVGKTTVCKLLMKKLDNCVFLDGDWCWNSAPFRVTEETKTMVTDNICHMLNNFLHCSAYDNVIFCWVMDHQYIIDSIINNLDAKNHTVKNISLIADPKTLRERLSRDVTAGLRSADIIERSIARLELYQSLDTVKIDTSGKTPDTVADEILRL